MLSMGAYDTKHRVTGTATTHPDLQRFAQLLGRLYRLTADEREHLLAAAGGHADAIRKLLGKQ